MIKTRLDTQCQTLLAHLTNSRHSMSTTWTNLDSHKDSRTGCKHGRTVRMMLMITQMMNTPKTEGSLGLRRGVISWHCCQLFRSFAQLPILDVFFSLSGLSKSVYKATLPYFLFFFLFLLSCLIFSSIAT